MTQLRGLAGYLLLVLVDVLRETHAFPAALPE
jgi:hypothetical protein